MQTVTLLIIGFAAGILSGMFGIGGGLIIVPSLITLVGMNTKAAIGTSLAAILLPVGILDELKKLIPSAKTFVLDNVGHLPHAERVDEFVDIVCR